MFSILAEQKIQEAIRRGELENLALRGKPIPKEDLSGVPDELRMGYKILKNAGFLPEELQINRDMVQLKDLLLCCHDEEERKSLKRQLSLKQLHFDLLQERNRRNRAFAQYQQRVLGRIGL